MSVLIRTPGTLTRVLFFLLAFCAGAVLLMQGFPPGAPDRFPVLLVSLGLALLAAVRPDAAIPLFAFLFPCAGLLTQFSGGTDPTAWPAILFGGLATGWCFRFIYDFESSPQPSRLDPWLRALLGVWALSTLLAVVRAHTLWAVLRGLTGRAVNSEGLMDAEATRESLFAFSALAAGGVFFFLLRRSGEAVRARALKGALWGVSASAGAACIQKLGWLPAATRGYWTRTQRLAGAAADPNSLGLMCGLLLVVALAGGVRRQKSAAVSWIVLAVLVAGLALSGSRSGLLLVLVSLGILVARSLRPALRLAGVGVLLGLAVVLGILTAGAAPGTLGGRLAQSFDPSLPIEFRVSARPVLWRAAWDLFLRDPIAGAGTGAFAWRFPDLMREQNRRFAMRDNPGSGYLQALAETGAIGALLTVCFALSLAAQALGGGLSTEGEKERSPAGVAVVAFLIALFLGSHWLAPDVALLFFLLAAVAVTPPRSPSLAAPPVLRRAAILLYAAAAAAAALASGDPRETFRYAPRIGFHALEVGPGGPFRWTRRHFALWLERADRVRLGLGHYTPENVPVEVSASWEGRPLYRGRFAPGEARTLLLRGVVHGPRAVEFSLSRSFVPKRLGISSDRRELGMQSSISRE